MEIGFQFRLLWSDEDVLKVRIYASNGEFGAAADVYVAVGGLAEAAAILEGFPRSPSDTRELVLGSFGPEWAGGGVRLHSDCKGAAGHAFVEVTVESDNDDSRPFETAHFFVGVEADAVDILVSGLRHIEAERAGSVHVSAIGAGSLAIAVGTTITGCPPHRPGRALISASGSYLG